MQTLDEVFPPAGTKRNVAARAFTHVLILANGGFLDVAQGYDTRDITIAFTAA